MTTGKLWFTTRIVDQIAIARKSIMNEIKLNIRNIVILSNISHVIDIVSSAIMNGK